MVLGFPLAHAGGLTSWLAPDQQPLRRSFGLSAHNPHSKLQIHRREAAHQPFCILNEFTTERSPDKHILLVAPLSGHFAFILRELVAGLVEDAHVSVTDWLNARHIPPTAGEFGFDDNIDVIMQAIRGIGPNAHVVALCQGAMPALGATAILAQSDPVFAPRSLTMIGGPVDPLASPTAVVGLIRQRTQNWLENNVLQTIGPHYAGAGRRVYPAIHQLSALTAYLYRHLISGGELTRKIVNDDGLDPVHFPFLDLFASLMDLPAKYFLENVEKIYLSRQAWNGTLNWHDETIDFRAIRNTALLTIEGGRDDIAAPGQTRAAHRLCPNVPNDMRRSLIVPEAGHFSLFHGKTCREQVLPAIRAFIQTAPRTVSVPKSARCA